VDVAIIGGGPAGLFAAELLARASHRVTIFDRMPTPGRKFLLAGRGGLNLTHSESLESFVARYGDAPSIAEAVRRFTPNELRMWADDLGAQTFVGTSGRVFPKELRATPLLRAWLLRLSAQGVTFRSHCKWVGFGEGRVLRFCSTTKNEQLEQNDTFTYEPDVTILALGGASWPRLGSDGTWIQAFSEYGIDVEPLRSANSGFLIDWSSHVQSFAGQPLKNISVSVGPHTADSHTAGLHTVTGELMIDPRGLEGGAIYALGRSIRSLLPVNGTDGSAEIFIDLRADVSIDALKNRLAAGPGKQSTSTWLRKAGGLTPAAIAVFREAENYEDQIVSARSNVAPAMVAERIKRLPLRVRNTYPIDRAISTAGGVKFTELSESFELVKRPGTYVIGEMVDWEAPTGGYLLQACYSMASMAAEHIINGSGTHH
jgi:uncharacterized flavoprotein (TIGR03862 family)